MFNEIEIPIKIDTVTAVFILSVKRVRFPMREKKNMSEIERPKNAARVFV
ncbi:MAG: hypothetical protein SCALA701_24510 [Candidatus Scalindua sp.]|nr:MAG: hypothetical protein SCALA701_24510 [Candidatus Scalindua sp.]